MSNLNFHSLKLFKRAGRAALAFAFVAAAWLPSISTATAASEVKFTITVEVVNLRAQPSLLAANVAQAHKGEFYIATGRTSDNAWVRLSLEGTPSAGWMLNDLGAVAEGKLASLTSVPAQNRIPYAGRASYPKWIPTITPQQRAIYRNSASYGKDVQMFTVAGDCNSQPAVYLQRIAAGLYDVSRLGPLQATVVRFGRSFSRISLAARGGFDTSGMLDPSWADPALCDKTVGPFACEVWVSRASVIFIELGTGDQYEWKNFEQNYRPLVEHALKKGVLPVLATKADDLEAASGAPSGYINSVIRTLALEYKVPLLDFWAASRTLPNNGLLDEGGLDFHLSPAGRDLHMLVTLQTLDAISR
jgi:hypothetical protein